MATHSSVLVRRIPGMGEPGGLLSMGSHRVRHDWSDLAAAAEEEEEEKNKVYNKISEEIIVENFPNMEKEIVNQVQEAQSPIQDKSKEKHAKTYTNQVNKD